MVIGLQIQSFYSEIQQLSADSLALQQRSDRACAEANELSSTLAQLLAEYDKLNHDIANLHKSINEKKRLAIELLNADSSF